MTGKPIYQVIPGTIPVIVFQDIKWYMRNRSEILEWCKENNITIDDTLWEIYLNSIDEATMFKLRFGV